MSDYVVHFTTTSGGVNDYDNIMSILSNRQLVPKARFGIGKALAPADVDQTAVCFSEIPPGQWERLVAKRKTKYGLAFSKQYLLKRGGGPIWYAWKDTPHWYALQTLMQQSISNSHAPIWDLTTLIDAPGEYGQSKYMFEWEREWRYRGIMNFDEQDVAFLLIPEELHEAARNFFEVAQIEQLGPPYFCPYIDPTWTREKILATLIQ